MSPSTSNANRRRRRSSTASLESAIHLTPSRPKRPLPTRLRSSLLSHRSHEPHSSSDESSDENDIEGGLSDVEHAVSYHPSSSPSESRELEGEEVDTSLLCSSPPHRSFFARLNAGKGKGVDPGEYGCRPLKRRRVEREIESGNLTDVERMDEDDTFGTVAALRKAAYRSLGPGQSAGEITNLMHGLNPMSEPTMSDSEDDIQVSTSLLPPSHPSISGRIYLKRESSDVEMSSPRVPKRYLNGAHGKCPGRYPQQRITSLTRRSNPGRYLRRRMNVKRAHEVLTASSKPMPVLMSRKASTDTFVDQGMDISDEDEDLVNDSLMEMELEMELAMEDDGYNRYHTSILNRRFQTETRHKHNSHLRRSSPTSLFPLRENRPRNHKCYVHTPARIGILHLQTLRANVSHQVKRRDRLSAFNQRTQNDSWRDKVGKWSFWSEVVAAINPWWLAPEEDLVESLLTSKDSAEELDICHQPLPETFIPIKRELRDLDQLVGDSGYGLEVSERWARRNELRLRTEVKAYVDHLNLLQRQQEERERSERILEEVRRAREMIERELREEQRLEAERLAQAEAEALEDEEVDTISEPPEYEPEFPSYPISIPRPRHLFSSSTPEARLPDYRSHRHQTPYNRRSPSPPPPFNALTDRTTLIAPVFIDEDSDPEEEEVVIAPIPVRPVLVGSFPIAQERHDEIETETESEAEEDDDVEIEMRNVEEDDDLIESGLSWEAAIDLEGGYEIPPREEERRIGGPGAVLGSIGRILGLW